MLTYKRDPRRSRQRGEGMLGCLFWAAILAVVVLIAWEAVPAKMASANFYDFMEETARFPGKRSEAKIKQDLLRRAKELDLDIDPKNIEVSKDRSRIKMKASYTIPLEFPGYTHEWDFEQEIDRPIFIF